MKIDIRTEAAKYYDANPDFLQDVPFYQNLIPSAEASILELGCGTGRVTMALIPYCGYYHGLDISPAMISICQQKLAEAKIPLASARVEEADITQFRLDRTFDLIIAPFRVFQNIETDEEVDGVFAGIHQHLAKNGSCILNVFMPNRDRERLRREWVSNEENLSWETPIEGGRLACFDRRPRMDAEKLILYPELIYRHYAGEALVEEAVLKIVMRCYYPDEFENLVLEHGFKIINCWGGYQGETYGLGPELVLQFGEGR